MDRIEAAAHIEAEQEKRLEPLKLDMSRYKARKVSNHVHSLNQALGDRIWPLFEPYAQTLDKPFSFASLMGIIKRKGPKFVEWCYTEVKESYDLGKANNPLKLFLWKIKQAPVPLQEIQ